MCKQLVKSSLHTSCDMYVVSFQLGSEINVYTKQSNGTLNQKPGISSVDTGFKPIEY